MAHSRNHSIRKIEAIEGARNFVLLNAIKESQDHASLYKIKITYEVYEASDRLFHSPYHCAPFTPEAP